MNDLTARLSSHDDPRLYREADELMHEAAVEITLLRADLANARAAALEEAAVICEQYGGAWDVTTQCFAHAIRAAIPKREKT